MKTIESDLRAKNLSDGNDLEAMRETLDLLNDNYLGRNSLNRTIIHEGSSRPIPSRLVTLESESERRPSGRPIATTIMSFIAYVGRDGSGSVTVDFSEQIRWSNYFYLVHVELRGEIEKLLLTQMTENICTLKEEMSPVFVKCPRSKMSQYSCDCVTCATRRLGMRIWGINV